MSTEASPLQPSNPPTLNARPQKAILRVYVRELSNYKPKGCVYCVIKCGNFEKVTEQVRNCKWPTDETMLSYSGMDVVVHVYERCEGADIFVGNTGALQIPNPNEQTEVAYKLVEHPEIELRVRAVLHDIAALLSGKISLTEFANAGAGASDELRKRDSSMVAPRVKTTASGRSGLLGAFASGTDDFDPLAMRPMRNRMRSVMIDGGLGRDESFSEGWSHSIHPLANAKKLQEGWLLKQGPKWPKTYKKRWFVLYDNGRLCYFRSSWDVGVTEPLGTIMLDGATCDIHDDEDDEKAIITARHRSQALEAAIESYKKFNPGCPAFVIEQRTRSPEEEQQKAAAIARAKAMQKRFTMGDGMLAGGGGGGGGLFSSRAEVPFSAPIRPGGPKTGIDKFKFVVTSPTSFSGDEEFVNRSYVVCTEGPEAQDEREEWVSQIKDVIFELAEKSKLTTQVGDYKQFQKILTGPSDSKQVLAHNTTVIHLFDLIPIVGEEKIILPLILLFDDMRKGGALDLCKAGILNDIRTATTIQTLFRRNSVSTKLISLFFKVHALGYLQATIGKFVAQIMAKPSGYELDPERLKLQYDESDIPDLIVENTLNLSSLCIKILESIFASVDKCPKPVRMLLNFTRRNVEAKFRSQSTDGLKPHQLQQSANGVPQQQPQQEVTEAPIDWSPEAIAERRRHNSLRRYTISIKDILESQENLRNNENEMKRQQQEQQSRRSKNGDVAVGGLIFLRFFCPALITPNLFGLVDTVPSKEAQRALTMVTKVLQNVANGAIFSKKEAFMIVMNDFVQQSIPKVSLFLHAISDLDAEKTEPYNAENFLHNKDQLKLRFFHSLHQHFMDCKNEGKFLVKEWEALPTESERVGVKRLYDSIISDLSSLTGK